MDNISSKLARIRRLIQVSFYHRYRNSRLRNTVLALLSRNRTERFIGGFQRYVIFLTHGVNDVQGGILSICSIASETQKLMAAKRVSVAVCTGYGEPRLLRYTKFSNDLEILAFSDLITRFPNGSHVLVHVPEFFLEQFVCRCAFVYTSRPDINWQFNILLQNIDWLPSRELVDMVKKIGPTTATTAHKAYTTLETSEHLGCEVHYLSWWVYPEAFEKTDYGRKDKMIIISPDSHPAKSEIVQRMSRALPDHKIIEIRNISYWKFRSLIKRSKFTFTFGEGLDGYFIETIFSGGIAMAIFNERFFTLDYRDLDGVFPNSADAILHVAEFIRAADNEVRYHTIAKKQHQLTSKNYVREEYLKNIRSFYDKYYH